MHETVVPEDPAEDDDEAAGPLPLNSSRLITATAYGSTELLGSLSHGIKSSPITGVQISLYSYVRGGLSQNSQWKFAPSPGNLAHVADDLYLEFNQIKFHQM